MCVERWRIDENYVNNIRWLCKCFRRFRFRSRRRHCRVCDECIDVVWWTCYHIDEKKIFDVEHV